MWIKILTDEHGSGKSSRPLGEGAIQSDGLSSYWSILSAPAEVTRCWPVRSRVCAVTFSSLESRFSCSRQTWGMTGRRTWWLISATFVLVTVLQLRLQQRRTREQLADQGIMPRKYISSLSPFHGFKLTSAVNSINYSQNLTGSNCLPSVYTVSRWAQSILCELVAKCM